MKRFLCAGPDSPVNRYWCWILLYRANSLTKHIGVFSLVFAKVSGTDDSSIDCVCMMVVESFWLLSEALAMTTTEVAVDDGMTPALPPPPTPPPPPLPPITAGTLPLLGALTVLLLMLVVPGVVVAVEEEIPPDSCC